MNPWFIEQGPVLALRAFAMNRTTLDKLKRELGTDGDASAIRQLTGIHIFMDETLADGEIETGPYLTIQARMDARGKGLTVPQPPASP